MTSFETTWLDLREPADHAARDSALLSRAAAVALQRAASGPPRILDLGCGTGSTVRALSPHLPAQTRWSLFDNDVRLLAEAKRRLGAGFSIVAIEGDLGHVAAVPVDEADLLTASALFDLASQAWLERFVARLASTRTPLYAALSVDGRVTFSEPVDGDAEILAAFLKHQERDKGMGAALGPRAGTQLAKLLTDIGWVVETAPSDWQLDRSHDRLEVAFIEGMAEAAAEEDEGCRDLASEWLAQRRARIGTGCRVGHMDLLAVPAEG